MTPFAKRLRAKRLAKGFSQKQLAKKLGVCEQTEIHWEMGRRLPDYDHLRRLSKTLNVSGDWLLGLRAWKETP